MAYIERPPQDLIKRKYMTKTEYFDLEKDDYFYVLNLNVNPPCLMLATVGMIDPDDDHHRVRCHIDIEDCAQVFWVTFDDCYFPKSWAAVTIPTEEPQEESAKMLALSMFALAMQRKKRDEALLPTE